MCFPIKFHSCYHATRDPRSYLVVFFTIPHHPTTEEKNSKQCHRAFKKFNLIVGDNILCKLFSHSIVNFEMHLLPPSMDILLRVYSYHQKKWHPHYSGGLLRIIKAPFI